MTIVQCDQYPVDRFRKCFHIIFEALYFTLFILDFDIIIIGRTVGGYYQWLIVGVTIITGVATGNMVCRLADSRRPIMTAETRANHICMIDPDNRNPAGIAVTVLAQVIGLDMLGILAGSGGAVMAAGTVAGIGVIEVGRRPCAGTMAVIAGIDAGKVLSMLAGCRGAVVTGEAAAR